MIRAYLEDSMLPYGATDLAKALRVVRKNTIQAAQDIPESQYDFSPAPGSRTVRQLLVHIALGDTFAGLHKDKLTSFDGVNFPQLMAAMKAVEQQPLPKAEIIAMLTERGEETAAWLETMTDEFLCELFHQPPGMQPPTKTRLEMLMGMKEHEMHHRGQLMLIQRILGIVPHLTRQMQARA